jgi:hypothetical protein
MQIVSYHHDIIGYRKMRYPIIELKYKSGKKSVYSSFCCICLGESARDTAVYVDKL